MSLRTRSDASRPALQRSLGAAFLCLLATASGCDRLDMYDQPRYEPLEPTDFFHDGLSARPLPEGTIARGQLHEDQAFYAGKVKGRLVSQVPEAAYRAIYQRTASRFKQPYEEIEPSVLRLALLERGRERFNIYCSVCHGATGIGDGMIVRRGFRKPPSYHTERLRNAPAGHFFEVISNGFGAMASYASRVEVADRWAIVAYIRALQLSQSAELEDVPPEQRAALTQLRETSSGNDDERTGDGVNQDEVNDDEENKADKRLEPEEDVR